MNEENFKLVSIFSRAKILENIKNFLNSNGLILINGKSGSGKSVLLRQIAYEVNGILFDSPLMNLADFKLEIEKNSSKKRLILFDEFVLASAEIIDFVRILSDKFCIILSLHKKIEIFKKEHFKSRILSEFELKNLSEFELKKYLENKFNLKIEDKNLRFLMKYYQNNLRNIDKIAPFFIILRQFYKDKKSDNFLLHLALLEFGFLK